MLQKADFLFNNWRYYIMLENKFLSTIQFVELDEMNFNTFSYEYISLLELIGSEIDTIFKEYYHINTNITHKMNPNICDYHKAICGDDTINACGVFPDISKWEVLTIYGKPIKLRPFEKWGNSADYSSLNFWQAYNDIKHNRTIKSNQASLNNVLTALSALFLLEMELCKMIATQTREENDIPSPDSSLFRIEGWITNAISPSDLLYVESDPPSPLQLIRPQSSM